jgi:hypothetical protein
MISEDQAKRIAVERAEHTGWGFSLPLVVELRRSWTGAARSYRVCSNPALRGTCTEIVIDAQTGAVLSARHLPR